MRTVFLIISSGYLIYLSIKIMMKGSNIAFIRPENLPNLFDGIILQLVNPKAYAFHSILFSGFVIYPNDIIIETISKFIVMNAIWVPLHLVWLFMGSSIKKINLEPNTQRKINLLMGLSLFLVSILSFLSIKKI